jgi:SNF2 family DNA or RNA helicase
MGCGRVCRANELGCGVTAIESRQAIETASYIASILPTKIQSISSGRIDFIPYQYRPVLKMLDSEDKRILIADEVGLGKTIEAGLILKELASRSELKTVLIICPKPLVAQSKWRDEMSNRFGENFTHMNGSDVRSALNRAYEDNAWPRRFSRGIIPFSLLNEESLMGDRENNGNAFGLNSLEQKLFFDLVVVDEAHHVRNSSTWRHKNIASICLRASAVVFMTATPIQNRNEDLYNILQILKPNLIRSMNQFDEFNRPNKYLNAAAALLRKKDEDWQSKARSLLNSANSTSWGKNGLLNASEISKLEKLLSLSDASNEDRISATRLFEGLNTFSQFTTRTRRKDLGSHFPIRKAITIKVDFSEKEKIFHDAVAAFIDDLYIAKYGKRSVSFLTTTIRRQMGSSIYAVGSVIEGLLHKYHDTVVDLLAASLDDDDETFEIREVPFMQMHINQMKNLIDLGTNLGLSDEKYLKVRGIVLQKILDTNPRVLIFTSFRGTLSYLHSKLSDEGVNCAVIHGDVSDADRMLTAARFKLGSENPEHLQVLICTEVGSEGLDYQFCDTVINYDLPWNPMRIEQRIGRIDRFGQASESISIINLITRETIDEVVYDRCLSKIGIFENAIGSNEDILGTLTSQIGDILSNLKLNANDRDMQLQLAVDATLHQMLEEELLENDSNRGKFCTLENLDAKILSGVSEDVISFQRLSILIRQYLRTIEKSIDFSFNIGRITVLNIPPLGKSQLTDDFTKLNSQFQVKSSWKTWLTSSEPKYPITLQREVAKSNTNVDLVDLTHPLIQAAAAYQLRTSQIENQSISDESLERQ